MRILAVGAYIALIFTLSSWPHPPSGPELKHLDKVVHAVEYSGLGAVLWWALEPRLKGIRRVAAILGVGLLVATADELYQGRTPGRESTPADGVADFLGLGLGAGLMQRREREREPRGRHD
jgi:VanZ family protein